MLHLRWVYRANSTQAAEGCSTCAGGADADPPSRIVYPTFEKTLTYDLRGKKIRGFSAVHFWAVRGGLKRQVITEADDHLGVALFRILQFLNLLFCDPEFVCQFLRGNLFQVYFLDNADRKAAYVAFLIKKALEFFITEF